MMTHYKIHKEGIIFIIIAFFIIVVPVWIMLRFINIALLFEILIKISSIFLWLFVLYFFRVPDRDINSNENAIIAPADGTIVQILKEVETEYFNKSKIQISIFMSPLNVHVNTYPIDGKVIYIKYHPGKHFIAHLPKASQDNEHCTVVQKHKNGEEVLFRQIAGTMARRIVNYAKRGDQAEQGKEVGIIKFGSRVDVFLPLSARINVQLNQKVQSKITHLAYFS